MIILVSGSVILILFSGQDDCIRMVISFRHEILIRMVFNYIRMMKSFQDDSQRIQDGRMHFGNGLRDDKIRRRNAGSTSGW